jgi:branched-chain amino acid transport system substrate-binding protein
MKHLWIIALTALWTCGAGAAEKPTVKIGVIAPLTGNQSSMGEEFKNSAILAVEELPDNLKVKVELVIEDNQNQPKLTALAANKLIFQDKVDAILTLYSMSGQVVSPVAEKNKVLHLSVAFDGNVAKGLYNFVHCTRPTAISELMLKKLREKKITRLAIASSNTQGSIAMVQELQKLAPQRGVEITYFDKFTPGETDFRMLISKMRATEPDGYLVLTFSPEQELFTQQFREAKIDKPLTSIFGFDNAQQPGMFEGLWYVACADAIPEVNARYAKRFGREARSNHINSYDMVKLVAKVYDELTAEGHKPDTTQAANALMKLSEYQGATSKLTMDSEGILHSAPSYKAIRNGKPTALQENE